MNKLTEQFFVNNPHGYFTNPEVVTLFPENNSRCGLIKRAIAKGEIVHIRRGLYCLAPKYQKKMINLYELAQTVYGPSYISLESALSWHGWIPEAVYSVTNASLGKSKEFNTPLGIFTYTRIPQKVFYAGVERKVDEAGYIFLIASPIKALADYVYVHKKNWQSLKPAIESLRIEPEDLETVTADDLDELIENYTTRRVTNFLKALKRDLKL